MIRGFVAIVLTVLLATWLALRGMDAEVRSFQASLNLLDDLGSAESVLHRDVLRVRAGMLRNFDPLVEEVDALRQAAGRLQSMSTKDRAIIAAINHLHALVLRQEQLTERFKSQNALLQNSLAYFSLFSGRVRTSSRHPELVHQISALSTAVLRLTLDTSPSAVAEIDHRMSGVSLEGLAALDAETTVALLAHARLLRNLLPATDKVLKALFALSGKQDREELRLILLGRQETAQQRAASLRYVVYAMSLILVGILVVFAARLRGWATTLQWNAKMEHLIAGISTRFINAQPNDIDHQVQRAVFELGESMEALRAYFVAAGSKPHVYRWHRPGFEFPPGWPDRALEFVARHEPNPSGIVYLKKTDRPDEEAFALSGASSWFYVISAGDNRRRAVLGFDLPPSTIVPPCNESGLFRVAFDAIANAIDRLHLEQEKARLEANLQQTRRMETVGALASGVAHNFNNIIGTILGYTEMTSSYLKAGSLPARHLGEIRQAGERARDLVDQILAFGRRGNVRRERVRLSSVIAETAEWLRASLPPHVRLEVADGASTAIVLGDTVQLQQVLLNLCNNGAQAIDGAGTVRIGFEEREVDQPVQLRSDSLPPGGYAVLSVADTGRGMDAAIMSRIFEPFFTTRVDGNGLGLATVWEIVSEHQGGVDVQSTLGRGTRFEIWLPSAQSPERSLSDQRDDPAARGNGETVLLLDADQDQLLRREEVLAALGYEPVGFWQPGPAEAALLAAPRRFDAAVLCHDPGRANGLELAARLHQAAPRLPIILVAASASEFEPSALVAAGITEVVRQPWSFAHLAGALGRRLAAAVDLMADKDARCSPS